MKIYDDMELYAKKAQSFIVITEKYPHRIYSHWLRWKKRGESKVRTANNPKYVYVGERERKERVSAMCNVFPIGSIRFLISMNKMKERNKHLTNEHEIVFHVPWSHKWLARNMGQMIKQWVIQFMFAANRFSIVAVCIQWLDAVCACLYASWREYHCVVQIIVAQHRFSIHSADVLVCNCVMDIQYNWIVS